MAIPGSRLSPVVPRASIERPNALGPAAPRIARPGENCWRVERADRFHCVQDAADCFRYVREALLGARRTIFILGWDLQAVDLDPTGIGSPGPTRLDEVLAHVARRRGLRCHILIWDYGALYTLERDPFLRWRLGWRMPRRVRFGFDDRHPLGGCHHQKVVVVDDAIAFCGSVNLTSHRLDTSAHLPVDPSRTTPLGSVYGPYHEVHAMVSGPAAARLGALARERWRALGEDRLPPLAGAGVEAEERPGGSVQREDRPRRRDDLWPAHVTPDLEDVDVAIARTDPGAGVQAPVRECEALILDSIAAAKQTVYIENQYFTSDVIGDALATRLREPDGPEVLVVVPRECDGWLERNTMGAFRDAVFRRLAAADRHGRLRIVCPMASCAQEVPTFVHSKVLVIDDTLLRIGSANFSRRSMGMDTECDLAAEAGDDARTREGIRRIRDRLLGEHLGLPPEEVGRETARAGSLCALVDARAHCDRTLVRIDPGAAPGATASSATPVATDAAPDARAPSDAAVLPDAMRAAADPDGPLDVGASVTDLIPPVEATYSHSPLRI